MTQRTLAARHETDLDQSESPHALLWFLTIDHANLAVPVRVVSDFYEYVVDGETYVAMPFEVRPMTDTDQTPSAELRMPNIDRRIAKALEVDMAGSRAIVSAVAHSSEDFDLSVSPRVPLDPEDLPEIYGFSQFELADARINIIDVVGRITLIDVMQEPWPFVRATADLFPGLRA